MDSKGVQAGIIIAVICIQAITIACTPHLTQPPPRPSTSPATSMISRAAATLPGMQSPRRAATRSDTQSSWPVPLPYSTESCWWSNWQAWISAPRCRSSLLLSWECCSSLWECSLPLSSPASLTPTAPMPLLLKSWVRLCLCRCLQDRLQPPARRYRPHLGHLCYRLIHPRPHPLTAHFWARQGPNQRTRTQAMIILHIIYRTILQTHSKDFNLIKWDGFIFLFCNWYILFIIY